MQQHHSQNAAQHAAQRQLCAHAVQLIRRGLRLGQLRFSMFLRRHHVLRLSFQFRLWRSGCLLRCLLRLFAVQRQQRQAHGVLFCGRLLCRGQRCLRCVLALRLAKEIGHRLLFRLLRFFSAAAQVPAAAPVPSPLPLQTQPRAAVHRTVSFCFQPVQFLLPGLLRPSVQAFPASGRSGR